MSMILMNSLGATLAVEDILIERNIEGRLGDDESEKAIAKERKRVAKKLIKREAFVDSKSHRMLKKIAKWMDGMHLDPIIGSALPGIGGFLTSVMQLPFIFVALFKIRSISLTLAVIFNMMLDSFLSLIPTLGAFLDFMWKSNSKNLAMIEGYVEDEVAVIKVARIKAFFSGFVLLIGGFITYWILSWVWGIIYGIYEKIMWMYNAVMNLSRKIDELTNWLKDSKWNPGNWFSQASIDELPMMLEELPMEFDDLLAMADSFSSLIA